MKSASTVRAIGITLGLLAISLVFQPYSGKQGQAHACGIGCAIAILGGGVLGVQSGILIVNSVFDGELVTKDENSGMTIRRRRIGPLANQYVVEDGNTKYVVGTQTEANALLNQRKLDAAAKAAAH